MVHRSIPRTTDDTAEVVPSAPLRFLVATGSLMSLFALASVWIGEMLGG